MIWCQGDSRKCWESPQLTPQLNTSLPHCTFLFSERVSWWSPGQKGFHLQTPARAHLCLRARVKNAFFCWSLDSQTLNSTPNPQAFFHYTCQDTTGEITSAVFWCPGPDTPFLPWFHLNPPTCSPLEHRWKIWWGWPRATPSHSAADPPSFHHLSVPSCRGQQPSTSTGCPHQHHSSLSATRWDVVRSPGGP